MDNGKIIAGKRKDDIDEIEIELVEGEIGALMNFAAKLAELVPVFTEKRSKFARGLAPCSAFPPPISMTPPCYAAPSRSCRKTALSPQGF